MNAKNKGGVKIKDFYGIFCIIQNKGIIKQLKECHLTKGSINHGWNNDGSINHGWSDDGSINLGWINNGSY